MAEDDLVEPDADQHPNQVDDVLGGRSCPKVAVTNCGQHLDSPVDTLEVEQECAGVDEVLANDPSVIIHLIKLRCQEPEAREEVDQEDAHDHEL